MEIKHHVEKSFNPDGRKNVKDLLMELSEVLHQRSFFNYERKENRHAIIENSSSAGKHEAYCSAATYIDMILEKKFKV